MDIAGYPIKLSKDDACKFEFKIDTDTDTDTLAQTN